MPTHKHNMNVRLATAESGCNPRIAHPAWVLVLAAVPGSVCPPWGRSFLFSGQRQNKKHKHYMTTSSLKPWSVRALPSGAAIVDSRGREIALFSDHRDADMVVTLVNATMNLKRTIDAEKALETMDEILDALKA